MEANNLKNYRMLYDYHTHTTFSHGSGSIEDNVKAAISKGLKGIGISDHGPGHLNYGVKRKNLPVMREEVNRLREKYPEIEIWLSVEANVNARFPYVDIKEKDKKYFDYIIGGYHYGCLHGFMIPNWLAAHNCSPKYHREKLSVNNTSMTVAAIYQNNLKILTHPGDKGPFDIDQIARACEQTGTLMEINMKHPFLSIEGIKTAAEYDVSFVISSDAHSPEKVGTFEAALDRALSAGLDPKRIVNIERI